MLSGSTGSPASSAAIVGADIAVDAEDAPAPFPFDPDLMRRVLEPAAFIDIDTAAAVRVNGNFAVGCIGAPLRVNVTAQIKTGSNTIEIQPQAPKSAHVSRDRAVAVPTEAPSKST